jgi:O-antigen/teichoic acid export membrane protein
VQQVVSLGSAILLIPIVTATLPSSEAGVWFVFQSLVGMIALVDLGFGFTIARQVAFTHGGGGENTLGSDFLNLAKGWPGVVQLLYLTRRLYVLLAAIAALLALLLFEVLANFGQLLPVLTLDVRMCWYALCVAIVFMILAGGQVAFLNGLGVIYQTRLLSAASLLVAASGAAIAALEGWGLTGMGASFGVAAVLQYAATLIVRGFATRKSRPHVVEPVPPGSLKALAKAALPVGGVNVFGSLVYSAQVPLLGFLLGPEKVAPFYLAQRIAQACNMAVMHTVTPQMPFFTRQYGAGNFSGALHLMNQTLLRTTALIALSSVSFFFLSPLVAKVLLHRVDFLETWPLALLALDVFVLGLTVPWAWFVLASGRNPFVPTTILNGLLMLLLCFLFVPRVGVSGIPISSIVAGTLTNHWFAVYTGLGLRRKLVESTVRHVS